MPEFSFHYKSLPANICRNTSKEVIMILMNRPEMNAKLYLVLRSFCTYMYNALQYEFYFVVVFIDRIQ